MKYCSMCGAELFDEAVICPKCGCSCDYDKEKGQSKIEKKTNGYAIAGFICAFFIPLLGWIFGGLGLSKAKTSNGNGKGLSIASIIVASIMFFVNVFLMLRNIH